MDRKKLRVREANEADQRAIKELVFGVLKEYAIGRCSSDPQDSDLDDLGGWYSRPGGVFEVLENDDGSIVGCGGVLKINEQRCELRKMYFLPELRGHGIGSAFLDRLINFARQAGYSWMELETASALNAAIALYQHRGFVEIEKKHDLERCDRAFELELKSYREPVSVVNLEQN